jgi:hypothetical protein
MEWRLGHIRRVAVVAIATTAACIGIAVPASAHNGEQHQAVLADEQQAGPFLVTAWTSEGMSTGEIPIAVEIKGGETISGLEVVAYTAGANQSPVSVALQAAPSLGTAVWEGVLLATDGQQELVIEVADQNGRYQTAPIPMTVVVAGIGWAILIGVLAVQALGYLGWLVLRVPRVWRRQVVRVR